jgi:hypothetical protein
MTLLPTGVSAVAKKLTEACNVKQVLFLLEAIALFKINITNWCNHHVIFRHNRNKKLVARSEREIFNMKIAHTVVISWFIYVSIGLCPSLSFSRQAIAAGDIAMSLHNGLLSIDAKAVSAEYVLKNLVEVSGIKIVGNKDTFPDALVTLKFNNVPLEDAIKRILRSTKSRNYIIKYQKTGNNNRIEEIAFLSEGKSGELVSKRENLFQPSNAVSSITQPNSPLIPMVDSDEEINGRIENLGEQFRWDDPTTVELAKGILRGAPPQVRKYALTSITRSINTYLEKEGKDVVDKEMIYRAVEDAIPEDNLEMKNKAKSFLDSFNK